MRNIAVSARALAGLAPLLAAPFAHAALPSQTPIAIDGGPIGPIEINVGADGFGYIQTDAPAGTKTTGFQLGTALVNISTTTGLVRATVTVGPYSGLVLGYAPGTSTPGGQNYAPFSPLYNGYVSIVPNDHISFSAGQMGTPEGWESAQDWNNYSIFHSEIAYVEPGQARGVRANINEGPISAVVQLDDGYYSKRMNYMQLLATYTISPSLSITFNGATHIGTTGPYVPGIGNLLYNNSSLYGGWISYTKGNFTVTPEVQYVYTNPLHRYAPAAEIGGFAANFTSGVFADYTFAGTPYSLGGFTEYATETPSHKNGGSGDYFGFGPGSSLWGAALTPSWVHDKIFARADLAYVHVNTTNGGGIQSQFYGIGEVGLLY
jgi:hypothetical protein